MLAQIIFLVFHSHIIYVLHKSSSVAQTIKSPSQERGLVGHESQIGLNTCMLLQVPSLLPFL